MSPTRASMSAELQRALLPGDLPVLPGVDLAADYLVAADDRAGRGDWFDAVTLPDGRLGLGIGDVVGSGVEASAAMGRLRAVAGEWLNSTGDVEKTMAGLENYAVRHPEAYGATLCLVILHPQSGDYTYITAGHPPPLVATAGQPPRYLSQTHGGPLGSGRTLTQRMGQLQMGEAMLLFTDGLLARPGRPWTDRLATLSDLMGNVLAVPTVGEHQLTVERLCTELITALAPTCDEDDATVLAMQRRPVIEPLDLTLSAQPDMLSGLRSAVHRWARGLHLSPRDQYAIEFALSEAAANSIDHGYGGRPGPVHAHAGLDRGGAVELTIDDQGAWVEPETRLDGRGLGLAMIQDLTDELSVRPHEHGTTVSMRRILHRRSGIGTGPPLRERPDARQPPLDLGFRQGPATLTVSGPVDLTTDTELEAALQQHSAAGALPIDVDLSGVTHLASAGVRVLLRHAQQNPGARFVVKGTAPIADALVLVALPRLNVISAVREA